MHEIMLSAKFFYKNFFLQKKKEELITLYHYKTNMIN